MTQYEESLSFGLFIVQKKSLEDVVLALEKMINNKFAEKVVDIN